MRSILGTHARSLSIKSLDDTSDGINLIEQQPSEAASPTQAIIEIIGRKKPQNAQQLVKLVKENTFLQELEIMEHIARALIVEILAAAGICALSLYVLIALKTQDFELIKQALPKSLSKYLNTLENIIVR